MLLCSKAYFSCVGDFQAWNIESSTEHSLNGPVGQVYSMVVAKEMLFAGAQVTRASLIIVWNWFLLSVI